LPPPDKNKPAKPDTVKRPPELKGAKFLLRLLMSVRNVNATYKFTEGTILPGFTQTPRLFGFDETWASPGVGFILGDQDANFGQTAARNGWLTKNSRLTAPFSQNQNTELTLRANVDLSSDFKVQLDANKVSNTAFQEIFRYDSAKSLAAGTDVFNSLSPSRSGSYKISFMTINTAFANNSSINSDVFKQFESNLSIIKKRFEDNPINVGNEFSLKSQDVLIPAFVAAYSGTSADGVSLSPFPKVPIPNWRFTYEGLNKISGIKDVFQSVTLTHGYKSSYSVVNYSNSLQYTSVNLSNRVEDYNVVSFANKKSGTTDELIPVYIINQVMINESFQPLVGLNFRTKSKLNFRFEYKTKRDVSLNVSNAQVTEVNGKDWSAEVSFTKNNMRLPFKDQGRIITLKNNITFLLNVSMNNNQTIQRTLADAAQQVEGGSTITNGNINFQFRPNISYVVNQKLTIQIYGDHNTNEPLVTNSFPRTNTRVGFKILFNLAP
jgi:cell surface protein SprA